MRLRLPMTWTVATVPDVRGAFTSATGAVGQDAVVCLAPLQPLLPERVVSKRRGMSDNDEAAPGTGEHHVQAPPVREEPHAAEVVAADGAEEDHLLLAALVGVDRPDLKVLRVEVVLWLVLLPAPEAAEDRRDRLAQGLPEVADLGLVRRNHADLHDAELASGEDPAGDAQEAAGLRVVQLRFALAALALGHLDEADGHLGVRPLEPPRKRPPRAGDTGLQEAAVERGGAELEDLRVAPVLGVEEVRVDAVGYQPRVQ
mmetsp:Transcript_22591/g.63268  ORF Transcript_22591/g.63268 Transcript_22591/m.63268 type:complete len:258 (-) Transcript_22591:460-1233(-)